MAAVEILSGGDQESPDLVVARRPRNYDTDVPKGHGEAASEAGMSGRIRYETICPSGGLHPIGHNAP